MLICPKCRYDNELGRIFCHQCGTKLDLNQVKSPAQGGPKIRRKRKGAFGRMVRSAVVVAVVALIAWAIWLAGQVPDVATTKPTNAELLAVDNKRIDLEQLVGAKRAATLEVSRTELNTYLGNLGFAKPEKKTVRVVPKALQIDVRDGAVTLRFLGELQIGDAFGKRVFISYTGLPMVEDAYFEFKPVAGAVGKLPIHPLLLDATDMMGSFFARLFKSLYPDYKLLSQLSSISVKNDHVVLSCQRKTEEKTAGASH